MQQSSWNSFGQTKQTAANRRSRVLCESHVCLNGSAVCWCLLGRRCISSWRTRPSACSETTASVLSISQETSRYRPLVAHPIYQIWIKQILKVHTQSFSSKAKKKTKFPIRYTGLSRTFWHMHSYNKNTKGNQHGNDASCLLLIYPTTMVSRRGWRWGWLSRGWLCQCKSIFASSSAASLLSGEGLFQSEYVQLHLWPEYRYIKSQKKLNLSINTVLIILWPVPFF